MRFFTSQNFLLSLPLPSVQVAAAHSETGEREITNVRTCEVDNTGTSTRQGHRAQRDDVTKRARSK